MSLGQQCYMTFVASLRRAGFVSGPWGAFAKLSPVQQDAYTAAAETCRTEADRNFYRAYPWLKHRLEALDALLHPGTKAAPCSSVTLEGMALQDARSLLQDLQAHLARCYEPEMHTAFRRGQRRPKPPPTQEVLR